jgi:ferredoxin-NADP reductase
MASNPILCEKCPMPAHEYLCTVKSLKMLTPTVFELTFDTNNPMEFKAGQFISVIVPGAGPNGRDLRRAYSIASPPETKPVELCVKLVEGGPGTNFLYSCKPGMTFKGFAPYGDFVYKPRPGRRVCFLSTGTGIAPFRAMVLSSAYQENPPVAAYSFFGVREESEVLYLDELEGRKDLQWVTALSQPKGDWKGFRGRVTDYMRGLGADFPWLETDYYLCGNGQMISEVKALLTEKGVAKEAIHQEKYY